MSCICMFAPTADGGHARYTWEVLNALSVYPGAPHGLATTHKDKLNADLLAFLKS